MTRKVLLASIKVGGGHTALRDSFQLSLQRADPSGERFTLEPWESADERTEQTYQLIIRKFKPVHWLLHTLSESDLLFRTLLSMQSWMVDEAKQVMLEKRPDVVICTHFMLSCSFVMARNQLGLNTKIVTA